MMSDLSAIVLDTVWFYVYSKSDIKSVLANNMVQHVKECISQNLEVDPAVRVYVDLLEDLINDEVSGDDKASIKHLIMKQKQHRYVKNNPDILVDLEEVMTSSDTVSPRRLDIVKRKIRNYLVWARGEQSIRKLYNKSWKCGASRDATKQDIYLAEIQDAARELLGVHDDMADTAGAETIDYIDMSDKSSIQKAIDNHKNKAGRSKIVTGLKGLNEMFDGGMEIGELIGFAALTGNYKSGMLMDIARWIAIYNKPNVPTNTIPAIVFISLENEIFKNLNDWFRAAYVNAYQKEPDGLTDEEIRDYVADTYSRNGFRLLVFRYLGDDFGIKEFKELQAKLKAAGYYVVASIVDYLQLMNISDIELSKAGGNTPMALQNQAESLRDYASHNNQLICIGITLSSGAEEVASTNPPYVVTKFTAYHLAGSKSIKRPLSGLVFMHKQANHNGTEYMTYAWNKRRHKNPPDLKFCAYRFTPYGIMDDINGEPRYVTDIYAGDAGSEADSASGDERTAISVF
jgi:hypothetical protein